MTPEEALKKLKEFATHLDSVDYEEIVYLFENVIGHIPIPVAKLHNGVAIDRVRANDGDKLFKKVSELSYITDESVITNYLTEFGRGNCPHQPMFYGAIESSNIRHQRLTALSETSALFQDPKVVCIQGELYTVSRWRTGQESELAEMVFSKEAIAASADTYRAFEKQVSFLAAKGGGNKGFYRELLTFVSGQFARKKQSHHDYKISAAYTNVVLKHPSISGVAYPSVQTEYKGQNLVLPPSTVDKLLTLESVITQRLHKSAPEMFVNNHMECLDPLRDPGNLHWMKTPSKDVASPSEVWKHLFPS